nr:S8 family peptidase [Actinomyces oris]
MTMTLSRKRVLLISVASVAVICLIAVGLVRAGVLGGHKATAAASASAHGNAAKVTEPSDRFIISYAENSAAGKVIASAKAYGENVLNSLPAKDKEALTAAAGKFSVKLESVTAHAMSTAAVKLSGKLTVDQVKEFISTLEAADGIEAVEPDIHVTALGDTSAQDSNVPNDPYFSEQWDMTSGSYGINATNAWSQSTGKGVTVAVIDSGILTDHPDLKGQLLPGYDFISDAESARDNDGYDADPSDEGDWSEPGECSAHDAGSKHRDKGQQSTWHGSHVAGTIAARTNNGDGVAGVAPDAKIVPIRFLGRCGSDGANLVDAITWASGGKVNGVPVNKNRAQVINMSLGGPGACTRFLQKTIDSAVARGSIIVAAAGNSDEDAGNVNPASCENVITVGATTSTGTRSSFSNYGDTVEISAPGGEASKTSPKILSTTDESSTAPQAPAYSFMIGTSQAAPHVSGTIALMLAANPDLKTSEVVSILQNTATPMAKCDRKSCGAGIVNAASAVAEASSKTTRPSSKPSARPSAKPSVTSGGRTLRLGN